MLCLPCHLRILWISCSQIRVSRLVHCTCSSQMSPLIELMRTRAMHECTALVVTGISEWQKGQRIAISGSKLPTLLHIGNMVLIWCGGTLLFSVDSG